jgi:uncharacterized protein
MFKAAVAALILAAGLAVPVAAGPFEDGMAAYGRGDYAIAMRLLRPLADQGHAGAQNNIGWMCQNGWGVTRDYAAALSWYRRAADQGLAAAQRNLALLYEQGQGVSQDHAVALSWYRKAADQGDAAAQTNLGNMYLRGQGVSQDYAIALSWYRRAADQGLATAQRNLGLMYEQGQGVSQDYVSAFMWFNLAAGADYDAAKNRANVIVKMTPTQIAEAQKRAAEWRPKMASAAPMASPPTSSAPTFHGTLIPLQFEGGTFTVPVSINNKLTLNFVLDSGSADVSIPADVVSTLIRTGTLGAADFLGRQTYRLADGSTIPSQTFRIKSLKVGDKEMENVTGSVAAVEGSLLLGQSFLSRFKSWSIDNQRQVLILE